MARLIKELSGNTFGDFRVISYERTDKYGNAIWLCSCVKCGKEKMKIGSNLTHGRSINCLCVHFNATHHDSVNCKEYRAYKHMINRCYLKSTKEYCRYGARGITVCDRWRESYTNFLSDMGRAPSPHHSLDRVDNNKGYYPENCRWATIKQQANNKRRTYMVPFDGNEVPLGELCSRFGMPIELIRGRLNLGWDVRRAVTTANMRTTPIDIKTETETK